MLKIGANLNTFNFSNHIIFSLQILSLIIKYFFALYLPCIQGWLVLYLTFTLYSRLACCSLPRMCPVFKVGLFFTSHLSCNQGWLVLCLTFTLYSRLACCSLPRMCPVIKVGLFFALYLLCIQGWFVLCLIFALYSRLACSLSHICPVFKVGLFFALYLPCIQGWFVLCLIFALYSRLVVHCPTFALYSRLACPLSHIWSVFKVGMVLFVSHSVMSKVARTCQNWQHPCLHLPCIQIWQGLSLVDIFLVSGHCLHLSKAPVAHFTDVGLFSCMSPLMSYQIDATIESLVTKPANPIG